ncbi:DUF3754 domain-containing protein [Posidoniimonas polymericola]|nr:DUF3754 domain-containing protein [Posidoniimonas polymericola]
MHQTLGQDPLGQPPAPCWRPERRFVPARAEDLADCLVRDAARFGVEKAQLRQTLDAIRAVIEQEGSYFHSELELAYTRFNPDCETLTFDGPAPATDPKAEQSAYDTLHRQLAYLLDKANFERLDDIKIAEVVERASTARIAVRIHPDRVERLELWVRGHGETRARRRTLRCPVRGKETTTPVFKRLAVIAQLKGDSDVLVKLFKDIPEHDVEALLPHAEAAMTLLDRLKLFGSGAGAAGAMAMKLAKIALALTMLSQILWIVLIGVVTIALRTFFGYKNAKTSRNWRRTQRLYFQNLGNNASALQLLISSVKQEEMKEAYLGYAFSLESAAHASVAADFKTTSSANPSPPRGERLGEGVSKKTAGVVLESSAGLGERIEDYLAEKLGVEIDFDLPDAVETLTRLDLWRQPGSGVVCAPRDALLRLEDHRREQRSSNYHAEAIRLFVGEEPPANAARPHFADQNGAVQRDAAQLDRKLS